MNGNGAAAFPPLPRPPDLEVLETRLQSQLAAQVRHFQLLVRGNGLVLKGFARTYHARQFAGEAVRTATRWPILANEIEVR